MIVNHRIIIIRLECFHNVDLTLIKRVLTFYPFFFQRGAKAPQAAGRIHTDFEKGFIMAEVMKFDDFKEEGSEAACKVLANLHFQFLTFYFQFA